MKYFLKFNVRKSPSLPFEEIGTTTSRNILNSMQLSWPVTSNSSEID